MRLIAGGTSLSDKHPGKQFYEKARRSLVPCAEGWAA